MDGEQPKFKVPDISGFDAKKLYGVKSSGPQYVDYTKKQGRSTEGQIFFNVGCVWLAGMVGGGMYGLQEGWRTAAAPSFRIRMNSVLNAAGKRGNMYATRLGSGMFVYCMSDMAVANIPELTGLSNFGIELNKEYGEPAASGFVAGAAYACMRGPRAAVIAGGLGMGLSLAFTQAKSAIFNKY